MASMTPVIQLYQSFINDNGRHQDGRCENYDVAKLICLIIVFIMAHMRNHNLAVTDPAKFNTLQINGLSLIGSG
jgi:hypothetical protein